jgi:hypothetical protein
LSANLIIAAHVLRVFWLGKAALLSSGLCQETALRSPAGPSRHYSMGAA